MVGAFVTLLPKGLISHWNGPFGKPIIPSSLECVTLALCHYIYIKVFHNENDTGLPSLPRRQKNGMGLVLNVH